MDLSKIRIRAKKRNRLITPNDIFKSLTLRGAVENIWDTQAEALRRWHESRNKNDVMIEMSTGGGKTLVGLIIAQSIANETQGKVLYVCPTNQLVEQTATKAAECGMEVTTYIHGSWTGDSYDSCTGACVTNYAAVFNGRTIFREHDLRGIIFDDAHVAHNVIRSQFTLRLRSEHPAFRTIANLFRAHFGRNSQSQQLDDALGGNWQALLFVPMFEVQRNSNAMRRVLLDNGVADADETKFAWEHLKDRLSRCVTLFSGGYLEISPSILPVHILPYFQQEVRRIYLTATMPSQVEFVRTFGVVETVHIAPGGKSGEAQRLFLFMPGDTDKEQRDNAAELVADQKACIITPSGRTAQEWSIGGRYDGSLGHAGIEAFSNVKTPETIILVARYDGIDLPGAACRVLILDGLPMGESLIDRFVDQGLRIERLRLSHMATRIVQAIGRIFRSNTDHGAVIVCGEALHRWLRDPNHLQYMPELLQRQIQLAMELRRLPESGKPKPSDLLQAVLQGRDDWDTFYTENIANFETHRPTDESEWFNQLILQEKAAYAQLWDGNAAAAADAYQELAESTWSRDRRLGAWYWHWAGLACDIGGREEVAVRAYLQAANERAELGRPRIRSGKVVPAEDIEVSTQARSIARLTGRGRRKLVKKIRQLKAAMVYGGGTNPTEQALCDLGILLGLEASRPDREQGTGPDVVWCCTGEPAGIALEAKTNKGSNSQYKKTEDIGQFHDHIQWLKETCPDKTFLKVIVGRLLRVSPEANPPADLEIIPLEQFRGLLSRLENLLEFVESSAGSNSIETCVERGLQLFGLKWPNCVEALEGRLAIDLQTEQQVRT